MDNSVNRDELSQGIKKLKIKLTGLEIETLFNHLDQNRDGQISLDVFLALKNQSNRKTDLMLKSESI